MQLTPTAVVIGHPLRMERGFTVQEVAGDRQGFEPLDAFVGGGQGVDGRGINGGGKINGSGLLRTRRRVFVAGGSAVRSGGRSHSARGLRCRRGCGGGLAPLLAPSQVQKGSYPADDVAFRKLVEATLPPGHWILSNLWLNQARYTLVAPDTMRVQFAGCKSPHVLKFPSAVQAPSGGC